MIHVIPSATLPIVRQIADPSDTSTYYVRAVIRDSVSETILDTVNLVGQGSQRFTYNYPAPADPSGQGRYIDITTTVYSDSGYTTRTGIYADEVNTYLVKDDRILGGGGLGAGDFSYKEIRKIIKEELGKIEFPEINIPSIRDVTPEVIASERRIKERIDAIRIPEQIKPDMDKVVASISTTVDDALNTILIAVDQKEVTPPTDIESIVEKIQSLPIEDLKQSVENTIQVLKTLQSIVQANGEANESLRDAAEQFVKSIGTKKLPQKREVSQIDVHLNRARSLLGNPQFV